MTRCESYPPCFGTIYFPTAPFGYNVYLNVLYIIPRYQHNPTGMFLPL